MLTLKIETASGGGGGGGSGRVSHFSSSGYQQTFNQLLLIQPTTNAK